MHHQCQGAVLCSRRDKLIHLCMCACVHVLLDSHPCWKLDTQLPSTMQLDFVYRYLKVTVRYLQCEKHCVGPPLHPIRVYLILLYRTCQHTKSPVHNLKAYLQPLACHITRHSAVCSCCYALPVPTCCEAIHTVHLHTTVSPRFNSTSNSSRCCAPECTSASAADGRS